MRGILLFCVSSCLLFSACGGASDRPAAIPAADPEIAQYEAAADRLVSMLDNGYVVSRTMDGAPAHQGDALIWTGIAMGDLDCARGDALEHALLGMIEETGGKLYRHPTLKDDVSMEGAIGAYSGIASRIAHCFGARGTWGTILGRNPGFWKDPLNAAVGVDLPLGFKYVRDLLGFRLGLLPAPADGDLRELEREAAAWTRLVKAGKKAFDLGLIDAPPAAYRVHVAHRALLTVEALGVAITREGRDDFCAAAEGMGLLGVESWCGRGGLEDWIRGFQYDVWEFRFQRGAWETPDGQGLMTPAVDLIDALRQTYAVRHAASL